MVLKIWLVDVIDWFLRFSGDDDDCMAPLGRPQEMIAAFVPLPPSPLFGLHGLFNDLHKLRVVCFVNNVIRSCMTILSERQTAAQTFFLSKSGSNNFPPCYDKLLLARISLRLKVLCSSMYYSAWYLVW